MRTLEKTDLVGKTIKNIDITSINHLILHFTDGTFSSLWAEDAISTQYGNIPGIFISDDIGTEIIKE